VNPVTEPPVHIHDNVKKGSSQLGETSVAQQIVDFMARSETSIGFADLRTVG